MDPSLATQLSFLALLGIYWVVDVPRGYRRWAFLVVLLAFPMTREAPLQEVRLAFGAALTEGTVLEANCLGGKNHHAVRLRYRFLADGAGYTGSGLSGQGNPSCGHIAPGDTVRISYLPDAPQVSAPRTEPMAQLLMAMLGWLLMVLAFTWFKSDQGVRIRAFFRDLGPARR